MKMEERRKKAMACIMPALILAAALHSVSCASDNGTDGLADALVLSSRELPVKANGAYESPDGKATLDVDTPVRVLRLSGTSAEMGYNYGYLLAAEIMVTLNQFSCWVASEQGNTYGALAAYQGNVAWDAASLAELEGMLAGMRAALPEDDLTVRPEGADGHPVSLDDLKILNTLADWACSSFSVWGSGRASDSGSTLIARNLDYYIDPGAYIKQSHLIVSYNPDTGTRWVNVAFCGIIGCISGMNEYGVSAVIQNTIHLENTDDIGFVPRTIALRKVMEGTSAASVPADAETMLEGFPNYNGCNYLFAFPSEGRTDGDTIAGVMEYDGKADHSDGRVTHRTPSDNAGLPWDTTYDQRVSLPYVIINTNHYLKRSTDIPAGSTTRRYCTIKEMLPDALSGDSHVSREEGRAIMEAVGGYGTLHTTIFEPDNLFLRIYFSSGSMGAFEYPAHDFQFEDFF